MQEYVIIEDGGPVITGTESLDEVRKRGEALAHGEPGTRFFVYHLEGSVFEEKKTTWTHQAETLARSSPYGATPYAYENAKEIAGKKDRS
jgi:hypothetical protein